MKYIIRKVYTVPGKSPGWQATVGCKGKAYSRFFNDRKLGGRELALAAARAWVAEQVQMRMAAPTRALAYTGPRRTKQRQDLPPGVTFCKSGLDSRGHRRGAYYCTRVQTNSLTRSRLFRVDVYGPAGARTAAIRQREEWEALMWSLPASAWFQERRRARVVTLCQTAPSPLTSVSAA